MHFEKFTFHESTDLGLSEPCLKYPLEFSQRDTSWSPKGVDFCNQDSQLDNTQQMTINSVVIILQEK